MKVGPDGELNVASQNEAQPTTELSPQSGINIVSIGSIENLLDAARDRMKQGRDEASQVVEQGIKRIDALQDPDANEKINAIAKGLREQIALLQADDNFKLEGLQVVPGKETETSIPGFEINTNEPRKQTLDEVLTEEGIGGDSSSTVEDIQKAANAIPMPVKEGEFVKSEFEREQDERFLATEKATKKPAVEATPYTQDDLEDLAATVRQHAAEKSKSRVTRAPTSNEIPPEDIVMVSGPQVQAQAQQEVQQPEPEMEAVKTPEVKERPPQTFNDFLNNWNRIMKNDALLNDSKPGFEDLSKLKNILFDPKIFSTLQGGGLHLTPTSKISFTQFENYIYRYAGSQNLIGLHKAQIDEAIGAFEDLNYASTPVEAERDVEDIEDRYKHLIPAGAPKKPKAAPIKPAEATPQPEVAPVSTPESAASEASTEVPVEPEAKVEAAVAPESQVAPVAEATPAQTEPAPQAQPEAAAAPESQGTPEEMKKSIDGLAKNLKNLVAQFGFRERDKLNKLLPDDYVRGIAGDIDRLSKVDFNSPEGFDTTNKILTNITGAIDTIGPVEQRGPIKDNREAIDGLGFTLRDIRGQVQQAISVFRSSNLPEAEVTIGNALRMVDSINRAAAFLNDRYKRMEQYSG